MKKLLLSVAATLATTLVPMSAFADTWPGYFEGDGSSRYMSIPNDDAFTIPESGVRTVSMKVKVNKMTSSQVFFSNRLRNYNGSKSESIGQVSGMMLSLETSKTVTAYLHTPASSWGDCKYSSTYLSMSNALTTNEGWVYISWVFDGTDQSTGNRFYTVKDGTVSKSTQACNHGFGSEIPSYGTLLVGAWYEMSETDYYYNCPLQYFAYSDIDDVRIYDAALTEDELKEDATSDTPLAGKTLIAGYNFSNVVTNADGSLNIEDISGNGHTGTLGGTWGTYEDVKSTITINTPDAEEGTLKVYNGDTEVTSGAEVVEGTNLKIVATPTKDYVLSGVTANDTQISANSDGEYIYNVNTEAVTISASFASKKDFTPTVTFAQPSDGGSLAVKVGGSEIASGDKLAYESEVTIEPTPKTFAYKLSSLTVNGNEHAADEYGVYSFTITEDTEIAAAFATKYDKAEGEEAMTVTNATSDTDKGRNVYSITFTTDNNVVRGTVDIPHEEKAETDRAVWQDMTDQTIKVQPGDNIKVTATGTGTGIGMYLYIDYNKDYVFDYTVDKANNKTATNSELVTFNGYRYDGSNWYDSAGNPTVKPTEVNGPAQEIPAFTIPSDLPLGRYYARFKLDYDDIDPVKTTNWPLRNLNAEQIDFVIQVQSKDEREVSVSVPTHGTVAADVTYGTVKIKDHGSDTSISTSDNVIVEAYPNNDLYLIEFMGWTNENGDLLSTDKAFDYNKKDAAKLVAHFGFPVYAEVTGSATVNVSYVNKGFTDISGNKKKSAPALRAESDESTESSTSTTASYLDNANIDLTSGSGSAVLEAGTTAYINASSEGNTIRRVYVYDKFTGQVEEYDIADDANLYNATLAIDIDAPKDVNVTYYANSTGVEDIAVDGDNAEAEYYNLNGVRVTGDLAPGLYIRRTANKAQKVVIR